MKKRIFIVDDDIFIQKGLNLILEKEGYAVETFDRGEEVLKCLWANPDLILLDVQLGGMDGAEICKSLKENSKTNSIPVILISSVDDLKTIAEYALADDYIKKPFNVTEVIAKVAGQIRNKLVKSA